MKVRIKSFNGELPRCFTLNKEYDCDIHLGEIWIINDFGDDRNIMIENCKHLNGGSWEIVE